MHETITGFDKENLHHVGALFHGEPTARFKSSQHCSKVRFATEMIELVVATDPLPRELRGR